MNWNFEPVLTKEVPVLRSSTGLPIPWDRMVKQFETRTDDKEVSSLFIPLKFWTEGRGKPKADCTTEAVKGWLKASFAGFRASEEKRRDGELLPCQLAVTEAKDGEPGHMIYMVESDVEARKIMIDRAKKMQAKAKKAGGAKKAVKKKATRSGSQQAQQAAE